MGTQLYPLGVRVLKFILYITLLSGCATADELCLAREAHGDQCFMLRQSIAIPVLEALPVMPAGELGPGGWYLTTGANGS